MALNYNRSVTSKNISKSIRLSEEVYAYIDGYQGEGFNQKFDNIILDAMLSEQHRKAKLEVLDRQIADKERQLRELSADYEVYSNIRRQATYLEKTVSELADRSKRHVSQKNSQAPAAAD